ncbi:MAG TPA: hypothetical protein DCE80_16615 [Ignavibacteriales bacterium]|nr:hypothetical protein [Ignavibacteriales bacterium]
MKVLFIEPYPIEGPSSRYRVEQYIPYLQNQGVKCLVRPFVSLSFYRVLYKNGFFLKKIAYFILSTLNRLGDVFIALRVDIVFIHLESYPLGPPLLECFLAICGKKIIYDLDDAIYLGKSSLANVFLKYLKFPAKIPQIIKLSSHVITCNLFLADYASGFNKRITVIHTGLDTEKFCPRLDKPIREKLTIGWIGSHSTAIYLEQLKNVFSLLAEKYTFKLKIVGAGNHNLHIPGVEVIQLEWKLYDEIVQFQSLDIGVYPLPEEEWVLGKTGFKTIQFMSVGIPCVVSNVGTNSLIVNDGLNGFLAKTEDEWVEKLSRLMESQELRKKVGEAGRQTIIEKYSLKVNAPKFLEVLRKTYDRKHRK